MEGLKQLKRQFQASRARYALICSYYIDYSSVVVAIQIVALKGLTGYPAADPGETYIQNQQAHGVSLKTGSGPGNASRE